MSADRFDTPDLTRRILAATSGSACARAESLLDADLDPVDRALLAGHLVRCTPCRELAETLAWALPVLPTLAERDPGRLFTAAVLARTSRRPTRGLVPSLERLMLAVQALGQRPRFALEAGWVGAVIAAILIWSPIAPNGTADQALAAVQTGGAVVPRLVQSSVPELTVKIEQEVDAARQGLRERASDVAARGHSFWQAIFGVELTNDQG
jgi:hypothetical protein